MSELRVAVVGGGLSGLCAGLALAQLGWPVTIIERAAGEPPGGAGLGLDRSLLARVTGTDAARIPVVSGNRPSAAWGLVRQFLLDAALAAAGIEVIESATVTGIRDHDRAGPVTLDSTAGAFTADVVVGADGVYSVTRRFVAPDQPTASYAGYMLWRGLVPEQRVPGGLRGHGRDLEVHVAPGAQLVIYCVPGADGRTDVGRRRVSCAWYDASRTQLLRESGCIRDGTVAATLPADQLTAGLTAELATLARRWWPPPWGECVAWGVTHGAIFGTPVAEYLPPRLVRGRVALVGDAAHVATPMTGAGFQNALLDVQALTSSLHGAPGLDVPAGLDRYERERLPHARRLVSSGMSWGNSYLSSAGDGGDVLPRRESSGPGRDAGQDCRARPGRAAHRAQAGRREDTRARPRPGLSRDDARRGPAGSLRAPAPAAARQRVRQWLAARESAGRWRLIPGPGAYRCRC